MITALLTTAVVWCMFYGRVPSTALASVCTGLGIVMALPGRHKHTRFFTIDVAAQVSRLNRVNPSLKLWTALSLAVLCTGSSSPFVGVFLTAAALVFVVCLGGLKLREYAHMLTLPVSFLMMSALVLLFIVTERGAGILGVQVFGFWICATRETQIHATLITARALGAISCLYALSLTTPMSDIIGSLRRARCPDVLIDLMYLIYRYVFTLLAMYHTMRDAAKSRLGYADYVTGMRTAGDLYAVLLGRSYRHAGRNFDAMESRCFDTGIRFLENREKATGLHAAFAICMVLFTLSLSLMLR
jgi:cobalt/nickel transport system permease protein